ncbi:MAG: 3'(2'),5'-bisphosphate nucleotidase CysQ [Myxococcales bacterium FL481]|nr:MAG: 3'(2'),5'-bisphosphate nucleotidase CysQ [Myxococcales bacterium FL481]
MCGPTSSSSARHRPMTCLSEELNVARELALEAGQVALAYLQRGPTALAAYDKPDGGGLVTRADFELDEMIGSRLRRRYPSDAVLTEESPDDGERHRRDRCWMIDPIDGTRDFAGGLATWAIHVGLCIAGVPRLGVVAEPATGRVTWGICTGARREAVSETAARSDALRIDHSVTPLHVVSPCDAHEPDIGRLVTTLTARHERRLGSVGIKLCAVARGTVDVYVHPTAGTSLWDTCAPQAIVEAAGGRLTDVAGAKLQHHGPGSRHEHGLLAASGRVHPQVIAAMPSHLRRWAEAVGPR